MLQSSEMMQECRLLKMQKFLQNANTKKPALKILQQSITNNNNAHHRKHLLTPSAWSKSISCPKEESIILQKTHLVGLLKTPTNKHYSSDRR